MKCPNCAYEIDSLGLPNLGQPMMFTSSPDQDIRQGKDYLIGKLGIAHRLRYISVNKFRQISIRAEVRAGWFPYEVDKIKEGRFKAPLYIFEFTDAWVICLTEDIAQWLLQNKPEVHPNRDNLMTSGAYIPFDDLPHLLIEKDGIYGK